MAVLSPQYRLSWSGQETEDLKEINRRLAVQLQHADEMIRALFSVVKDLTARVEALE